MAAPDDGEEIDLMKYLPKSKEIDLEKDKNIDLDKKSENVVS